MTLVTGTVQDLGHAPMDGTLYARPARFLPAGNVVYAPERTPYKIEGGTISVELAPGPAVLELRVGTHARDEFRVVIPDQAEVTLSELIEEVFPWEPEQVSLFVAERAAAEQAKNDAVAAAGDAETAKGAAEAAALQTGQDRTAVADDKAVVVSHVQALAEPNDAAVLGLISEGADTATKAALNATYGRKSEAVVSVLDYGAVANTGAIQNAAIQAAINANPGRTIHIPNVGGLAAVYEIDGTYTTGTVMGCGLKLDKAGTFLSLDPGVYLQVKATSSPNYAAVRVSAPRCGVVGPGTIRGDVATHTGTTGEYGYLVDVDAGADDFSISNVTLSEAWGDGLLVRGAVKRGSALLVKMVNNRRQGVSLIDCDGFKMWNCRAEGTGRIKSTAPAAGFCVEPDPSSGRNVTNYGFYNCDAIDNAGTGFHLVAATDQATTGEVVGCTALGNGKHGFDTEAWPAPFTWACVLSSCVSQGNERSGFFITTTNTILANPISRDDAQRGIHLQRAVTVSSPVIERAGFTGIDVYTGAGGSTITNPVVRHSSQATNSEFPDIEIWSPNVKVSGGSIEATPVAPQGGVRGNVAKYGVVLRAAAAGSKVLGLTASGQYGVRTVENLAGSSAELSPFPGLPLAMPTASRPGATTVPAGTSYWDTTLNKRVTSTGSAWVESA